MSINILIFENEVYIANEIAIRLKNKGYDNVRIALTKKKAISMIEQSFPDIAILDLREPTDKEAGIKLAEMLNERNPIPIIYFTAHPSDKVDVYRTKPNAFIEKPNYGDVIHALDLAVRNFYESKQKMEGDFHYFSKNFLFILKKGLYHKVENKDILYVKADSGCIIIHTKLGKFSCSSTIKRFVEQVVDPIFLLIHRSYLVNFHFIDSFNNHQVIIHEEILPMSKSGYENLLSVVRRFKTK